MDNTPRRETGNIGFGILGFCIPLVGLILYLVWRDNKPADAKMAGLGALIGVLGGVVLYVLTFILAALGSSVA